MIGTETICDRHNVVMQSDYQQEKPKEFSKHQMTIKYIPLKIMIQQSDRRYKHMCYPSFDKNLDPEKSKIAYENDSRQCRFVGSNIRHAQRIEKTLPRIKNNKRDKMEKDTSESL